MATVLSAEPAAPVWLQADVEGSSTSEATTPPESARGSDAAHTDDLDELENHTSGALVVHSASALAKQDEQPQDQLEELLAELGRIETQQEKLRDAVRHNKQIVVHPRQEVLDETDSEYDTPKAPTPKKKLVVSGGLTGFGIAQDLLQIDFSPPEEAPEEFRAVAFFEEKKEIKPGLSGSFGLCDPASKEMHHYLERLEEQQRLVLELITGKKQQLFEQYGSKSLSKSGKQGSKMRSTKSRLSRSTRFADQGEKATVAAALGVGSSGKPGSLGTMGSLSLTGKGALSAKLPMVGLSDAGEAGPSPPRRAAAAAKPRTGVQTRRPVQVVHRKAEVQAEDLTAKEVEEIKSQFAAPMLGSTPSTQHLAGKKGAKERALAAAAAAAVAEEEGASPMSATNSDAATPDASSEGGRTPPKASPKARGEVKLHAVASAGRVSTLGGEGEPPTSPVAAKAGMFRGLKKMLKGKSKS